MNKLKIKYPSLKVTFMSIGILVALFVIADITTLGYMKYVYYDVKCGGQPTMFAPNPFIASQEKTYFKPGWSLDRIWVRNTYFCTEAEAQQAGYVRDSLSN